MMLLLEIGMTEKLYPQFSRGVSEAQREMSDVRLPLSSKFMIPKHQDYHTNSVQVPHN